MLYFTFLPPLLAIALSPTTFLMYSWATAVEDLKDNAAVLSVLRSQREQGFRDQLKTLSRLCDCFELLTVNERRAKLTAWETLQEGSPDTLLNLLTVFDLADADKGGSISRDEVASIAHNLGYEMSDTDLESFMEVATGQHDIGGEHTAREEDAIQFREFASAVLSLSGTPSADEVDERSNRLFGFFDIDRSGVVEIDEMASRLEGMGFDTAGTEQLFVDITGMPQNTISSDEFAAYIRKIGL